MSIANLPKELRVGLKEEESYEKEFLKFLKKSKSKEEAEEDDDDLY